MLVDALCLSPPYNHIRAEGLEVATGDGVQSSSSLVLLR